MCVLLCVDVGIPYMCYNMCRRQRTTPQFPPSTFMWILWIEIVSLDLWSKYFTHWAILLAPILNSFVNKTDNPQKGTLIFSSHIRLELGG